MTTADVTEGAPAPEFDLPRDGGGSVSLASFTGKPVVLYFYPKDDTSGCTTQALDFTARAEEFTAAGATVLGVSKDPVKSHEKFRDKHGLKVALLSDEGSDTAERYGVWGEKKMYGRTFMGIERATFLIDGEGRIARVWRKVKVPGHVDEVLEAVKAM
ncbi:thioredoxin-dependent thiol peroxidase [Wenxinia marina]|uniref:thioredoxin-dependent peroxiredoxin n=1 Tax=Wenxinia marina DSM 24838 TaxID=1123501 RepID=A0A0D0Q687_9RHOB|nr:thioredoxin-dependent thiol peroxidase [Wenxinia marina]KIQ69984.1 Peroxiredoxin [Wenxinia marina DSM 24838]GGL62672.1 peroxiredoxin [Wenxinia marina]